MITITLKGIPKDVHRELKKRAVANRRSLNNEVIFALETSLFDNSRPVLQIEKSAKPTKKFVRRK